MNIDNVWSDFKYWYTYVVPFMAIFNVALSCANLGLFPLKDTFAMIGVTTIVMVPFSFLFAILLPQKK